MTLTHHNMASIKTQLPKVLLRINCQKTVGATSTLYISKRHESNLQVVQGQHSNLAAYKRGRGGRSSFSGVVATVLGCTGFFGRYVVNRLGKSGCQVVCPYRGDPYFVKDLKLAGDLGQILFLPFDLRDEDSLRKVMQYSNVVINLIGRDYETRNYTFGDVHIKGAETVARIAKEMGAQRFVHFSHLNASPDPQAIVGNGSMYLKTKYLGEQAVRDVFPEATIFRPSDMYGHEDRFINYYLSRERLGSTGIPLYKQGTETIKSPVFVSDVAEGVVNAIYDEDTVGKIIECVGPKSYLLSDLVAYLGKCTRRREIHGAPWSLVYKQKVKLHQMLHPTRPYLNLDRLDREHVSDKVQGYQNLEDLGVTLTKVEDRILYDTKPYRTSQCYEEQIGEHADPIPPPVVPVSAAA